MVFKKKKKNLASFVFWSSARKERCYFARFADIYIRRSTLFFFNFLRLISVRATSESTVVCKSRNAFQWSLKDPPWGLEQTV